MENDNREKKNSEQRFRLEKEIIPKITQALGKDGGEMRCEIKVPSTGFFISTIYMVDLIFCGDGGGEENQRVRLVVKMQPKDESTRAYMRSDMLFHNEIVFYRHLGDKYGDYPKCVFMLSEPISEAVIVLENVTQFGFVHSVRSNEDVGLKRTLAAVREIGKFHGQGYTLKEKDPEKFFEVVKELRDLYDDAAHPVYIECTNTMLIRPVNYLRSVNYDKEFCDKMSNFVSNAHVNIIQDCMKPRNELAVVCHGDFTLNNLLFKEQNHGEFKVMLIDFAQLRYASPATDLSTFLYLSCEDKVRKDFPIVFRAYHDAVLEYLKEQGIQDLERYSFDAFLKDYKRHSIFGCGIATYFIPVMNLTDHPDIENLLNDKTKQFENVRVTGGDALSKRLADMLLELRDNGCLDHVI